MKKILITGIIITLILPMILSNSFATVIELESSDIKVNESKDKTIESSINIDNKDIEELNKESELNEETEKNENEIEISNYNTKNIEEDVPLVIENELNSLEILTVDEELVNSQKIIENGTYQIVSALNNNKVVDVEGPYSYSGANVHIFQNYNKTNQKFKINYIEQGYYTIEAVHSGKVLDVAGAGTTNGTNVQQWESNNTDAQKWIIKDAGDGYYYIVSKCNDLYLDVASADTRDGNNIHVFQGNGTLAQKFKFKEVASSNATKTIENGTYQIISALNNNKVVDVEGPYSYSGANVHIFQNYNKTNQKFKIKYIEDGYYIIEAVHSGKVLDVASAGTSNGTNVHQWEINNTDAQKWIIKDAGYGYYYVISKCNDLYLDVASADTRDGNNIHVFQGNGTLAQRFKFKEVASSNAVKTIESGTYQIISALNNNKVVDVEGPYNHSGANVHIFQNYDKNNQKFKIYYIEQGYYTIEAVHSGKVLDVAGAGTINGTNVQQWESNNTDAQKWIIKEAGDGYYYIISRCNDLYLDVASADTRDGNNIHVFQGNGTLAQKFKFKETEVERLYNGIDVSEFNGDINWSLVQQTQDFAIIRVGYRGYLRPRIVMDEKFIQNIKGAQSVGLSCGIYFFSQAITEAEAIEEANWVADTISVYSIKYPVVLDSEWSNGSHNGRADYLTKQERTKVAKAFLDTIKNRGYMPMLYANPDWLYNYIDASQFSSYDLWLAHYTGSIDIPSYYSGTYTMWQYTSEGNVNGVNGNVDRNVCYKQY